MKKLFILAFFVLFCQAINAQQTRLNIYSGYVFDDKIDSYFDPTSFYQGTIKGGYQWGLSLEFLQRNMGIELSYLRQDTKAPMTYFNNGVKSTNFNVGMDWLMVGLNRYFRQPGSKIEPFFGASVGLLLGKATNPTTGNSNNGAKLGLGLKGGTNIWLSDRIALKLQAQLMSGVQSVGGGIYFGTGGAGLGLSSYSSMYQFGLGGGLVFQLGKK